MFMNLLGENLRNRGLNKFSEIYLSIKEYEKKMK